MRYRGHNQARTINQGLDKDSTQLCEESLDLPHRGNPKSSRNSSESTNRGTKLVSRFYPKQNNKYRRGRGLLSYGSWSWRAILFRIRKFSKFLYKPADQYSDTKQTTAIDRPIGTVTILQSVSAEINQTGIDSLNEFLFNISDSCNQSVWGWRHPKCDTESMEGNHGRFFNESVYIDWPTEKGSTKEMGLSVSKSNLAKTVFGKFLLVTLSFTCFHYQTH